MSGWKYVRRGLLAAAGLAVAGVVAGAAGPSVAQDNTAAANEVYGGCKPTKSKVSTAADVIYHYQMDYSPVDNAKIKFKLKKKDCVIVRFSTNASSVLEGAMYLRAVLDGKKLMAPGQVVMTSNDDQYYRAHSMEFVMTGVKPGKHTVTIEWHAADPNKPVSMGPRTTVVQYR
jgi:hypothetical protein